MIRSISFWVLVQVVLTAVFVPPSDAGIRAFCEGLFAPKERRPLDASRWPQLDHNPRLYAGLVTSQTKELYDHRAQVEFVGASEIPSDLRGILFSNGAGRYEWGNDRASNLIAPVSAMIASFDFRDDREVWVNTRHVRTTRYTSEEKAGRLLTPTWLTRPHGLSAPLDLIPDNQASVTVLPLDNGRLLALDDMQPAFTLDQKSLQPTANPQPLDPEHPGWRYLSHHRRDPVTGHIHFLSLFPGPKFYIRFIEMTPQGRVIARRELTLAEPVLIHDWAMTQGHYVLVLHPYQFSPRGMMSILAGRGVIGDMFEYNTSAPTKIQLVSRRDGSSRLFTGPSRFFWHIMNAFESAGKLTVRLSASSRAIDLLSRQSPYRQVVDPAYKKPDFEPGIHAPVVELEADLHGSGRFQERIVTATANYDFPAMHPDYQGRDHRYGWFLRALARPEEGRTPYSILANEIVKVDFVSGAEVASVKFQDYEFATEPVFVPRGEQEEDGYIMTIVYSAQTKRSYLAVCNARDLKLLFNVHLPYHLPMRFHGAWVARR